MVSWLRLGTKVDGHGSTQTIEDGGAKHMWFFSLDKKQTQMNKDRQRYQNHQGSNGCKGKKNG